MKITKILSIITAVIAIGLAGFAAYKNFDDGNRMMGVYSVAIALAALVYIIMACVTKEGCDQALVVPVAIAMLASFTLTKFLSGQGVSTQNATTAFYLLLVAALLACIVFKNKYKGCAIAAIVIAGIFVYNPYQGLAYFLEAKNKFYVMTSGAYILTYVTFMLSFAGALIGNNEAASEDNAE